MLVLTVVQPVPVVGQPQVEAQLIEFAIGFVQALPASRSRRLAGANEQLLKVERAVHEALHHRMAMKFGEGLAFRYQPGEQVETAGENDEVVVHGRSLLL